MPSRLEGGAQRDHLPHLVRGRWRRSTSRTTAFVVAVPNDFTREWIEGHFLGLLRAIVQDATGRERRIRSRSDDGRHATPPGGIDPLAAVAERVPRTGGALNSKYTFDSFVIGSSNRFAHAAALAVAEAPAQAYNPLFIYGGTGLGKTHLLQAIAQYVAEHTGQLTARYVTSETFMNDFINSLRDKRIEGFKHRYRNYDLLLVDDIQFFEGKERIQEEFFHTFNSLYEAGPADRALVRPAAARHRHARGAAAIAVRVGADHRHPAARPRDAQAILRKKVKSDGIEVRDEQVLTFIAGRVSTNIRELEGALTRVVAFSSLTGRPMTVDLAQDVLRDVFPQGEPAAGLDPADPGDRRANASASRWTSSAATSARRTSSTRARSRCTSRASSPTRRCRRSARSSAAATTPP